MDYTSSLETIGIIPILAPKELMEQNQWLGHVKISIPYKMAVVSLNSSYEHFCAETLDQKMEIILNNILESLQLIKKKLKGKFHYEDMEKAILEIGKRHIELQRFRMANGKWLFEFYFL